MPEKPVIIEFEGLAGCGKSTLCEVLKNRLTEKGYSVVFLDERPFRSYFKGFRRYHIHRYIQTFSACALVSCVKFMIAAKMYKEIKRIVQLYELSAVYRWFGKTSGPDSVMVCDQSLIQTIVSFWGYDHKIQLSSNEKRAVGQFLKAAPVTDSFYCALQLEENLKRIRKRARNHGRLNLVSDDGVLYNMLDNNLNTLLQVIEIKKSISAEYRLDMNRTADGLAENVLEILRL